MRSPGAATLTAAAVLAVAVCTPLAGRAATIRPGETDNRDWTLGLIGHGVPDVLKTARADPYAAPAAPACETIPREIAALDEVLGPDSDAPAVKTKMRVRAEGLVMQGIRGFIPHRDWIRFATGAGRRDKALNEAAMAGWARRGFLKGMEINLGCPERPASARRELRDGSAAKPTDAAVAGAEAPVLLRASATPAADLSR